LRSDHIMRGHKLDLFIAEATAQLPKLSDRPSAEEDMLFEADYDHPSNESTCAHCDNSRTIHRNPRRDRAPVVHYGLIASGNQVMKHARTRDKWGRKWGVLCFEMEAAGLMSNFPCLVIRGICDYADSHKKKRWQAYAALVAAAYMKELLNTIPAHQVAGTTLATKSMAEYSELSRFH
jgi:nucleoside phosphorylase